VIVMVIDLTIGIVIYNHWVHKFLGDDRFLKKCVHSMVVPWGGTGTPPVRWEIRSIRGSNHWLAQPRGPPLRLGGAPGTGQLGGGYC